MCLCPSCTSSDRRKGNCGLERRYGLSRPYWQWDPKVGCVAFSPQWKARCLSCPVARNCLGLWGLQSRGDGDGHLWHCKVRRVFLCSGAIQEWWKALASGSFHGPDKRRSVNGRASVQCELGWWSGYQHRADTVPQPGGAAGHVTLHVQLCKRHKGL